MSEMILNYMHVHVSGMFRIILQINEAMPITFTRFLHCIKADIYTANINNGYNTKRRLIRNSIKA